MKPLSLELFAWDKENATLTISHKEIEVANWGGNDVTVKSHKTQREYVFQWKGGYKKDSKNVAFWELLPEISQCPIKKLFMIDAPWPQEEIFIPQGPVSTIIA